ncbi:hypothetical protein LTR10_022105 [Elasticomyces elasticus]|uniref:Inner centromere protein ARK-binding domain-containing protein n=1 Tax=Exophiala sideris TaxID=1016849 RepID=A0ABR0IVI4_9EURO|nr:hypothetical protein LTR10_022105 [Elasticomyces elasticus]KAK5021469.1 hypothetical protein LTS07_010978 [Exophiala sideris]KAK5024508.1 hypothetical protein LTR13_010869 [Exophiala sideris]KAK5049601.1 hypothetical protein LTR69_011002 [Exophiala sideris]KAK5176604.1 hypothetical protein LTR44_010890 [Eurotiomycetes sp. CCFEE 6388]
MAPRTTAVGSTAWISAEKENALHLLQTEKEELVYPAQHQLEWLNEHMSEIFSKDHLDVTNVFKTPGKLRGKTPRTTRKRNVQDARIPLSDVFSSKPISRPSPSKQPSPDKLRFQIAVDPSEQNHEAVTRSHTDSGYHGSSQDDMEIGSKPQPPSTVLHPGPDSPDAIGKPDVHMEDVTEGGHRTTEGSFHSAKEDQTTKMANPSTTPDEQEIPETGSEDGQAQLAGSSEEGHKDSDTDLDEIASPSDASTPDIPLVRKSSLTFAALPAREPVKTSLDARTSRTSHVEQSRQLQTNVYRGSTAGPARQSEQQLKQADSEDLDVQDIDSGDDDENVEILGRDDSDDETQTVQTYSKSSTQRLHEKIDMLGKAPPPRPSKSIHSTVTVAATKLNEATSAQAQPGNDDEDDWIKPLTSPNAAATSPAKSTATGNGYMSEEEDEFDIRAPELIAHEERMKTPVRMSPGPGKIRPGYAHTKSASTATLVSPAKAAMAPATSPQKSISVSNPSQTTTTPHGSPKRYLDLSASKSKLQSIMKTAKGLFTTSASVSAAAKLETLSPNALRAAASAMPGMYPNLNGLLEDKPLPASPARQARKTRSSTEREKDEKRKDKEHQLMQRMNDQLEEAREKERRKAAVQKQAQEQTMKFDRSEYSAQSSPKRQGEEASYQDTIESAPPVGRGGRPVRPGREPPVNKTKPAPVSIRVGTLSQRVPPGASHAVPNTQEVLNAEPKRPGLNKKTSTISLQSATSNALKSSAQSQPAKPRALLAAERKKEQDEREAQRKLEQKREIERKRAAQQEEQRKQELKQRAEAEKRERERLAAEQAKRQAQQQAIERKRQETARKAEQQRLERAANEVAQSRPSSRLANQNTGRSLVNHPLPTNPAKPAKRPLEEELGSSRPQNSKYGGTGLTQGDSKRRKTDEESFVEPAARPMVSGAPIRQSQLGKKPSIFNHSSYTQAQSSSHMGQFPQPPTRAAPPQMQQYASGAKIPFADASNSAAPAKTPVSVMQQKTIQTVKSSPQYPNGDAINLPEIPTDSEDEDSDDDGNAFPIPDWATPGHLTEQLIRQEGMDGDAVFGPVAPLKMEEIFAKGNKDRLKRLRDRTSSANWTLSGDGLTLEEVKADREQRERMRVEGGWRFGH